MKWWRFKKIKQSIPIVMRDQMMRDSEVDWWQLKNLIIKHNYHRKTIISASHVLVFDESMSVFMPRYES